MSDLIIPPWWACEDKPFAGARVFRGYKGKGRGLLVLVSLDTYEGEEWIHVSYSRIGRIPSHEDTLLVKEGFIGDDFEAYAKYPKKSEYINDHPYCLHLWSPLDGRKITPGFRDKFALI